MAILMAFHWRAHDRPLKFESSLPSSGKKSVVKVGPPLTKLSGSVHVVSITTVNLCRMKTDKVALRVCSKHS